MGHAGSSRAFTTQNSPRLGPCPLRIPVRYKAIIATTTQLYSTVICTTIGSRFESGQHQTKGIGMCLVFRTYNQLVIARCEAAGVKVPNPGSRALVFNLLQFPANLLQNFWQFLKLCPARPKALSTLASGSCRPQSHTCLVLLQTL